MIEEQSLKIVTFDYTEQIVFGEEFTLYAEYINVGQHPIRNLFVSFEGDFEVDYPMYYIGEFDVDSTDVFEVTATNLDPGEYYTKVVFSYTNSYNQERTITKPIKVIVTEPPASEPEEAVEREEKESFWDKIKRFLLVLFDLGS